MLYKNLTVTTNQKSIIDKHTHKHTHTHRNPNITLKIVIKPQEKTTQRRKGKKYYKHNHQTVHKMVIGTYVSIITLHVNGLNAPTKRHRLAEWIQKQDPIYSIKHLEKS